MQTCLVFAFLFEEQYNLLLILPYILFYTAMKKSLQYAAFLFFCLIVSAHLSAQKINATLDWMENKHNFHLPVQPNNSFQIQTIEALANSNVVYTLPVVVHVITTGMQLVLLIIHLMQTLMQCLKH